MGQRKDKALRKLAILEFNRIPTKNKPKGGYVQDPDTGVIYCTGFRRIYQDTKRMMKRRHGCLNG